ncbi:hypothetical protein EV174_004573 [Coemansia sp. RSA 2320]|nr:hypothetical protein EV174_004573 [Coemansia sp. RSA 2320]
MTKTRLSSRRSTGASAHQRSALETPRRSNIRKYTENDGDDDDNLGGVWDFEAPMYYDFNNSKTPGQMADKWFDKKETMLPNRPSLSPSRIVVEEDGRLTLDDGTRSKKRTSTANTLQDNNAEFDTDDEIEFSNWKRDHSLPDSCDASPDETPKRLSQKANINKGQNPAGSSKRSTNPAAPTKATVPLASTKQRPVAAANGTGKVAKKPTRVVSAKALTVPIESSSFMRPTKVAARRLSMKKRDKASQKIIAEAIARSINRRLSQGIASGLTVPKPFSFHESKSTRGGAAVDDGPAPDAKREAKLSKKAHEHLIAKLTSKRKATAAAAGEVEDGEEQENSVVDNKPTTPPRKLQAMKSKPTVPKTPQFAKPKRIRRESSEVEVKPETKPVAKPKAIKPTPPAHISPPKRTVPQPFTFRSDAVAERHLLKLREEITKLKAEEEALRHFRANPLPAFPTPKKPKRQAPELHVSPFNLQTDVRGETYQRQLHERLAELEERQRQRMEFKARPIPSSIDQPFVPQPSAIPLTAIEEILLSTELRSEERRAYDDDRLERERIREEVLARKRHDEERREEEEIKRLRKLLVHKAQPVRHYKPVVIKPSDRPLTVPKTPQWSVRTRQRSATPTSPTC